MYQAWQWPAQSTDTTYAQPATAVAPTATAAATPAAVAAAAAAANTWPYGQYAVANMQQQWAWAAQNQYAYAASLAAGQQGAVAAAYPGVWPGQAAATTTAAAMSNAGAETSSTQSTTTAKSSTENSKGELTGTDSSEMEKLNQLRAQAQQWTSQQQTAAWGMPTGAVTPVTPALPTASTANPAATTTSANWGQNSWNQSGWNANQWAAAASQWQQASGAAGPTTTAAAIPSGSQGSVSEGSASGLQSNSQRNDPNKEVGKQVDMSELDKEEEEFDKQFTEWEKQFESWKDQNKDHPDKEAFAQYEKQWKAWREQLLQKKEEMKKKRAEKQASAVSAPAQTSAGGGTTSDIPGLDMQDDKSSSVTTVAPTNAMTSASGMPQVQGAIPTAAVAPSMAGATGVMDPSMMYQNQMRMPGAQQFMYMPPQQYMYPPMPGAPGMPPPMMPQQAMPYGAQQPPSAMMGQGDGGQSMMGQQQQQPPIPQTSGDVPPKRALLATPPPTGPGGRFDRPEMMNEGSDMMPPGGRMEPPYGPGPRDPHMMRGGGMDEEPYEEEWSFGRGRGGMDFFRGRGRGGPMRGRGRGRGGGHWGGDGDFDGGPPDCDMGPPGGQFDPDFPPDRFRGGPEIDTDAFDPEFSVLESSKFPPEPPSENASDMPPFEEGDFGPRGRPPGPPFQDRRFGPDGPFNDQGPPFNEQGPPFHNRPPFPRDSQYDDPQMYPPDFDERYPEGYDNSKGGPGEFDGPDDFDESGPPPGGKRFPPMRNEGRFMNNRFGPRGPPFGPRHPFEGDFAPRPPFDDRFHPFPDDGFRGDRFRMRGGRFPPPRGDFGGPPDRYPPPGEPPFGPRNFPPGDRFRFPPDEDFRGPNRGPPMRGGRFQIDYENRPASAVMGDDFKKYDAFDSDIINFRAGSRKKPQPSTPPPPSEPEALDKDERVKKPRMESSSKEDLKSEIPQKDAAEDNDVP